MPIEMKPEDVRMAVAWYEVVGKNIGSVTVPYDEIQAIANLLRENAAEIERLKAEIGRLGEQCRVLTLEYPKITRAEAITEFFERVCKEVEQTPNANEFFVNAWKEKFAEIAKEMKGETDEN